jgi:hypothetical protein
MFTVENGGGVSRPVERLGRFLHDREESHDNEPR